jgi:flagellar protein FlaG
MRGARALLSSFFLMRGITMELDIKNISGNAPVRDKRRSEAVKHNGKQAPPPELISKSDAPKKAEVERYMKKLFKSNMVLNKKLKYSVNEQLGQVVVKVIDSETDKVIKEIPPAELQRLYIRIREAIGLIIDEEI